MTIYDLLFILLFLGSITAVVIALVLRRSRLGKQILLTLVATWAIYIVVLVVADILAAPRVTPFGQDQCFDEMCFAVVKVQTLSLEKNAAVSPDTKTYVVTIRVTSHSRGRTQAEGGLRARLYVEGQFFRVAPAAQQSWEDQHGASAKLTQRLAPGQSVLSVNVFQTPYAISSPALALDQGFTPGYFILGESPFFHPPDILLLR